MGKYSGKTCRLLTMLVLTGSFFLVEIIVGYITNSLALVGDSYHMLSDVVALLVGFASVRISKWHTQKNTFGWARAEVLGALVNAVFLCALCFTIFVEALQRMFGDEHIHDPILMLVVGGAGLLINLIGLALFHGHGGGHGHSHGGGGHGHSHGHSHNHSKKKLLKKNSKNNSNGAATVPNGSIETPVPTSTSHSSSDPETDDDLEINNANLKSSAQLNMRGVFLHIAGDALGSVIVIISALVIKFVEGDWKYKVDPAMSMVMVLIIMGTTLPLLKESAFILLQTVPTHIHVENIKDKLVNKIEGVLAVHEFHVWQLAGNRIIASAHIRCHTLNDYMRIAEQVKSLFHNEGIHSTTIQPEFVEFEEIQSDRDCVLECGPDKQCYPATCCARNKAGKNGVITEGNLAEGGETVIRQRSNGSSNTSGEVCCDEAPASSSDVVIRTEGSL